MLSYYKMQLFLTTYFQYGTWLDTLSMAENVSFNEKDGQLLNWQTSTGLIESQMSAEEVDGTLS